MAHAQDNEVSKSFLIQLWLCFWLLVLHHLVGVQKSTRSECDMAECQMRKNDNEKAQDCRMVASNSCGRTFACVCISVFVCVCVFLPGMVTTKQKRCSAPLLRI